MGFIKRLDAAHFRIDGVCSQMIGAAMLRAATCTTWDSRQKEIEEAAKWSAVASTAAKAAESIKQMIGYLGLEGEYDGILPQPFAGAEAAKTDEEVLEAVDKMWRDAERRYREMTEGK